MASSKANDSSGADRPSWIVRVHFSGNDSVADDIIVGAGILIDQDHVVTCAHVIESTQGRSGESLSQESQSRQRIIVDFPAASRTSREAVVIPEEFRSISPDGSGDVATLRLIEPAPPNVTPAPLRSAHSTVGHSCRVLGFPKDNTDGRWAVGTLRGVAGPDWMWQQFDEPGSARVESGYSGSPVWDDVLQCVIGMIVARDKSQNIGVSYMIPTKMLAMVSPSVRNALTAAHDPRKNAQWESQYRGVVGQILRGDYFTGRVAALAQIVDWAATIDSEKAKTTAPVCIITGSPGCGKSALLARVTVLADKYVRTTSSGAKLIESTPPSAVPKEGCVSAALDLRGRTLSEISIALADAFGFPIDGNAEPRQVAAEAVHGILNLHHDTEDVADSPSILRIIILDSFDESNDPDDIASQLILPLASSRTSQAGLKLLIGVRGRLLAHRSQDVNPSTLVPGLSSAMVLNLDDEDLIEEADIKQYSLQLLLLNKEPALSSPYRKHLEIADKLAAAIARCAYPNYLVAQLTSRGFAESIEVLDLKLEQSLLDHLPASVGQALDGYLRQFGPDEQRVRDLLAPLAWAADGKACVPRDDLWLELANEISGERYSQADLRWLFRSRAATFLIEEAIGAPYVGYRLYHTALAEHMRDWQQDREREMVAAVNKRIVAALLRSVPSIDTANGTSLSWTDAPIYVTEYLSVHAARARVLGKLINDASFVVASNLDRLLQVLPQVTEPEGKRAAEILRLAAHQLRSCAPNERFSYLHLMALKYGNSDMRFDISEHEESSPWIARWAHSRSLYPTLNVGRHNEVIDIAIGQHEQRTVLLSADAHGTIQGRDLLTGRHLFPPLATSLSIRSLGAIVSQGRFLAFAVGDAGLSVIDLGERKPLGFPEPMTIGISASTEQWIEPCIIDRKLYVFYGNESGTWRHDLAKNTVTKWPNEKESPCFSAAATFDLDSRPHLVGIEGSHENISIAGYDLELGERNRLLQNIGSDASRLAVVSYRGQVSVAMVSGPGEGVSIYRFSDGTRLGHFRLEIDESPIAVSGTANEPDFDLVTADHTGALRAWDTDSADPLGPSELQPEIRSKYNTAVASVDGLSASGPDGVKRRAVLILHGATLAYGRKTNFDTSELSEFRSYALEDGEQIEQTITMGGAISAFRFAKNAPVLALGTITMGPLVVYDASNRRLVKCQEGGGVTCMASDHRGDRSLVLTGSMKDHGFRQFEFNESKLRSTDSRVINISNPKGRILALGIVYIRDVRKVALANYVTPSIIQVYDYKTLAQELSINLGAGCECNALFGLDNFLICGTTNRRVVVVDVERRLMLNEIDVGFMPTDLALIPPNIIIATGIADILRIDLILAIC